MKHSLRELTAIEAELDRPPAATTPAGSRGEQAAAEPFTELVRRPGQQLGPRHGAPRSRRRPPRRRWPSTATPSRSSISEDCPSRPPLHGRRRRHQRQLVLGRLQPAQPGDGPGLPADRRPLRQRRLDAARPGQRHVRHRARELVPDLRRRDRPQDQRRSGPRARGSTPTRPTAASSTRAATPTSRPASRSASPASPPSGPAASSPPRTRRVTYTGGLTVHGLTRHNACVEPGRLRRRERLRARRLPRRGRDQRRQHDHQPVDRQEAVPLEVGPRRTSPGTSRSPTAWPTTARSTASPPGSPALKRTSRSASTTPAGCSRLSSRR